MLTTPSISDRNLPWESGQQPYHGRPGVPDGMSLGGEASASSIAVAFDLRLTGRAATRSREARAHVRAGNRSG